MSFWFFFLVRVLIRTMTPAIRGSTRWRASSRLWHAAAIHRIGATRKREETIKKCQQQQQQAPTLRQRCWSSHVPHHLQPRSRVRWTGIQWRLPLQLPPSPTPREIETRLDLTMSNHLLNRLPKNCRVPSNNNNQIRTTGDYRPVLRGPVMWGDTRNRNEIEIALNMFIITINNNNSSSHKEAEVKNNRHRLHLLRISIDAIMTSRTRRQNLTDPRNSSSSSSTIRGQRMLCPPSYRLSLLTYFYKKFQWNGTTFN